MERKQNGTLEWNGTLTLYYIIIILYIQYIYIINSFHYLTPGTHAYTAANYNSMQLYNQGMLYIYTVYNFGSNCYVAAGNEGHWSG